MKAENTKFLTVVIQVMTLLLLPILLLPLFLPMLLEFLAELFNFGESLPVYTLTSIVVLAAATWIYRFFLPKQGALLQRREQRILDQLTRAIT